MKGAISFMKIIEQNKTKPRVINIGLTRFLDALNNQDIEAASIDWRPPYKGDDELKKLVDLSPSLRKKINLANEEAVSKIIDGNPVWVDILPAGEVIEGLEDYTIIHSGPPIDYEDMVMLHKRGMVSGCLFEGWAKTEEEAVELLKSGKIKMMSALDTNTVGAGTGIITKSVAMVIIEDKVTGKRAATFPAEGEFQGGFCGWGLYNEGIANNLKVMREKWLPIMRMAVKSLGGIPIKPILAESMQMGDENHTRQTASDLLFDKILLPAMFKLDIPKEDILDAMKYVVETPRFFHCFGQGASRTALIGADGIKYSTMVTAVCGNGVTFGIKVAGLPNKWFIAPAPMMKGKYTSPKFTIKDQLPWIGDSCVVECYGMGGLACSASPIVGNLRGLNLKQCIAITREMEKITITRNPSFPVPNIDFDFLPCGIDVVKVLETGITPEIHGGMFNYQGGLIGAGSARIPMECFKKAMEEFKKVYGE